MLRHINWYFNIFLERICHIVIVLGKLLGDVCESVCLWVCLHVCTCLSRAVLQNCRADLNVPKIFQHLYKPLCPSVRPSVCQSVGHQRTFSTITYDQLPGLKLKWVWGSMSMMAKISKKVKVTVSKVKVKLMILFFLFDWNWNEYTCSLRMAILNAFESHRSSDDGSKSVPVINEWCFFDGQFDFLWFCLKQRSMGAFICKTLW